MATFRGVVRHSRWWRGQPHRWSTVYQFQSTGSGTSMTDAGLLSLAEEDLAMCYVQHLDPQTTVYQVDFYSEDVGGAPLLSRTWGDWEDPGSGLVGTDGNWAPASGVPVTAAEVALLVEWDAGLSRTGKPVTFRKFYHAVPQSTSTGGDPDVAPTALTALTAQAEQLRTVWSSFDLLLGNARTLAGAATVRDHYAAHQMPRGRRSKKLLSSSIKPGSYVVVSPPSE